MTNDNQLTKLDKQYEDSVKSLNPNSPNYESEVLRLKKRLVKDKIKIQTPRFIAYLVVLACCLAYVLLSKGR